jgi:hypothetical protein
MTRRTMAERKRRQAERDTRRESLFVLLSRARRGVPLTPAEAALMFAHVEVELAEADELRRTVSGQQTAIQAAHDRTAAAEAAIVEAEAEAERYKADYLGACGHIAAMHAAAVGEIRGPIRGVVEDVEDVRAAYEAQHARADTLDRLCREQRKRADDAEAALARRPCAERVKTPALGNRLEDEPKNEADTYQAGNEYAAKERERGCDSPRDPCATPALCLNCVEHAETSRRETCDHPNNPQHVHDRSQSSFGAWRPRNDA